jgi:hypothetical protein
MLLLLQGIVYVVDCCFVKQRAYNPIVGLESLLVAPTSKVRHVLGFVYVAHMRRAIFIRQCV